MTTNLQAAHDKLNRALNFVSLAIELLRHDDDPAFVDDLTSLRADLRSVTYELGDVIKDKSTPNNAQLRKETAQPCE